MLSPDPWNSVDTEFQKGDFLGEIGKVTKDKTFVVIGLKGKKII